MNVSVISPKNCSGSAKLLANALSADFFRVHKEQDYFIPPPSHTVINYGSSKPIITDNKVFNHPNKVGTVINKLTTFELLKGKVNLPTVTEDIEVAKSWIDQGRYVVAREFHSASQGRGLFIANTKEQLDNLKSKFYTRYIHHRNELRINVYKGEILSVLEKTNGAPGEFALVLHRNCTTPALEDMIKQVGETIGLDFYGMDILVTDKGTLFLLEINSAPILFGVTLSKLAAKIKKEL